MPVITNTSVYLGRNQLHTKKMQKRWWLPLLAKLLQLFQRHQNQKLLSQGLVSFYLKVNKRFVQNSLMRTCKIQIVGYTRCSSLNKQSWFLINCSMQSWQLWFKSLHRSSKSSSWRCLKQNIAWRSKVYVIKRKSVLNCISILLLFHVISKA